MKKTLAAFILLASASTFAEKSEYKTETSLLQIESVQCKEINQGIQGVVESGYDLGGAKYRLFFSGGREVQVFCDVLKTLVLTKGFASLKISNLKEVTNTDTSTGVLESISIELPND